MLLYWKKTNKNLIANQTKKNCIVNPIKLMYRYIQVEMYRYIKVEIYRYIMVEMEPVPTNKLAD